MLLFMLLVLFAAITVLALPSSKERLDARVARRMSGAHVSRPRVSAVGNGSAGVLDSHNWAGAVLNAPPDTYESVTATFILPTPKQPRGASGSHSAAAWVGLDGDSCQNVVLQTGIDFTVSGDSEVSYDAWYQWYPEPSVDLDISFAAGDNVSLTVYASSSTSGHVIITNERTQKTVAETVESISTALCGQDAEWIVEDFEEDGSLVPFANFGQIVFSDASAQTKNGNVGPENATVIFLSQGSRDQAQAEVSESSVTVTYVGN